MKREFIINTWLQRGDGADSVENIIIHAAACAAPVAIANTGNRLNGFGPFAASGHRAKVVDAV